MKMTAYLTPYWRRIAARAEEILTDRIAEKRKQTVCSCHCLLSDNKARMQWMALDIKADESVLQTVREGGLAGKLWAFDTVFIDSPLRVFRP